VVDRLRSEDLMRKAVRIMHHKSFAVGHPRAEEGATFLLLRTRP